MNSKLDSLPKAYRQIAEMYLPKIEAMTQKQLNDWVDAIVEGRSKQAFDVLTTRMTTTEIIAAIRAGNQRLKAINAQAVGEAALRRQILKDIIFATINLFRSSVIDSTVTQTGGK